MTLLSVVRDGGVAVVTFASNSAYNVSAPPSAPKSGRLFFFAYSSA